MRRTWKHKSIHLLQEEYGNKENEKNPIEIVKNLVREMVLTAFSKGWEGPPFSITDLAKMHDIQVLPNESVVDARILPIEDGNFLIEYNPFQYPSRINFSVAHEIGHTLFSDCADMVRYRNAKLESHSWELESLCNVAAAEILLPYAVFSKDVSEVPMSLDGLFMLAEKYDASLESVFIRYCEVVDKPCMAIVSKLNGDGNFEVQYSVKSDRCPLEIDDGFIIPANSKVHECSKSGWTAHGIEQWDAFNNTRYRVYSVGLHALRKHKEPRVGVFLVPEFYDDDAEHEELYMVSGDATEPRDIEDNPNKIIAQVINTSAGLGFGFGKAISKKYPVSKAAIKTWKEAGNNFVLGESQLVQASDDVYIFQMIAQEGIFPKYGEIPLKYSSLHKCLKKLKFEAEKLGASVHMPLIGAGQAKGDWSIIKNMIFQELVKKKINVTVYTLPGAKPPLKKQKNLTLFDDDLF